MEICKDCIHKVRAFDDYIGECVKCVALRTYIIPEPLQGNGFYQVQKTGKCKFHNKEIYFDEDGFTQVRENPIEGKYETNRDIYE